MDAIALLREQLRQAHGALEATMEGVTSEQAHWVPSGNALPIAAHYAHIIFWEDMLVNVLFRDAEPLYATAYAGKTGASALPPLPGPDSDGLPAWDGWAKELRVDLAELRAYAQAVYGASDEFLASLKVDDLARTLDLSSLGLGPTPLWRILYGPFVGNVFNHLGEISCLKGMQGQRGYPV